MNHITSLCPQLVVRSAAEAIEFYQSALGARVLARHEHGFEPRVCGADLVVGDTRFSLTDELPGWNADAPDTLGGAPVLLQLGVVDADDAESVLRSLCAAGASIVLPLRPLAGELMARVRDPFGHAWLVRQQRELSVDEVRRRRDELTRRLAKDPTTIGTAAATAQARNADAVPQRQPACVHLVVGPVGAGKSTFALQLARERSAIRLTLDEWMTQLFRPDRPATDRIPWYRERAQRCIDQIWTLARQLTACGHDVVLEIGLLQRDERERFYARIDHAGLPLTIHVLDAARHIRRDRVLQRNREQGPTFSMPVPPDIFELASDLWHPPEHDECEGRDVRFSRTDGEEEGNDG